jgi:hypothetical protein
VIFKRVGRTSPETAFIVVQNVSGSTATAGFALAFDISASVDGVRVSQCKTTSNQAFAGVADADIANNAYGLVQVYGYRASVKIFSSTGSSVAGDNLTVVTGSTHWGLTPATSAGTSKAFGFLCAAVAGSSSSQYATTASAFIRAL